MAAPPNAAANSELVAGLKLRGLVKTERVRQAMLRVDRALFLPNTHLAYVDEPVMCAPFHLSAPHIYAMALECLDLRPALSFLNVGSGTGYLSYVAACILGPYAAHDAVERNPVLVDHARSVCASSSSSLAELNFIRFHQLDAFHLLAAAAAAGNHHHRTYDRIYIGAGCRTRMASQFQALLAVGGKMIIPVESELLCMTRDTETEFGSRVLMNVNFMKFVEPSAPHHALLATAVGHVGWLREEEEEGDDVVVAVFTESTTTGGLALARMRRIA